nr:SPOR domain-containing protein [uncultured Bacteroides sp.]
MIELAQHIEVLLLENDCVIVPGLGGFVAHYTPAVRVAEENIFLPPTRIIGFNPQLKMNDGLLVQSYMAVYGTNFSDATKIVDKTVEDLLAVLHDDGKVDLPNVGELRYSIHDTYDFIPYDNKITTPYLYGLDSFEMQELSKLQKPAGKTIPFNVPVATETKKHRFEIGIKPSHLANAAAMIAIIALFFFLSTPVENTEVIEANYAQLLPDELFEKIEKQSLVITPIVVHQQNKKTTSSQSKPSQSPRKKTIVPVAVREVKVNQQQPEVVAPQPKETQAALPVQVAKMPYHIIIASVGTEKDAEVMAKRLIDNGFSGAKAIIGDGKMRVSIQSCATQEEAYRALNKIRQNETYQNAWVLKK